MRRFRALDPGFGPTPQNPLLTGMEETGSEEERQFAGAS
jgi:hypothetical protein